MENKEISEKPFPKEVQGVVFDLDGTLLDTVKDIADIANHNLEKIGYNSIPVEEYKMFLGQGSAALLDHIFDKVKMSERDQAFYRTAYMTDYAKSTIGAETIFPGIAFLCEKIQANNIPMGVFTNKPHSIAGPLMEKIFPLLFYFVLGQREEYPRKPDPTQLLEKIEEMGFQPENILYVGDTDTDMETGNRGGFYTIGALWGYRDREELERSGADWIVEEPIEILNRIFEK